jgi:hypothetical protein
MPWRDVRGTAGVVGMRIACHDFGEDPSLHMTADHLGDIRSLLVVGALIDTMNKEPALPTPLLRLNYALAAANTVKVGRLWYGAPLELMLYGDDSDAAGLIRAVVALYDAVEPIFSADGGVDRLRSFVPLISHVSDVIRERIRWTEQASEGYPKDDVKKLHSEVGDAAMVMVYIERIEHAVDGD